MENLNLFGESIEDLKKQEEEQERLKQEKKKQEAEQKKAEQEKIKKEKEEKINYTFTTIGDVKSEITKALEEIAESDPQFKNKFKIEKMDVCYNWLIEQIKKAYTSANGSKNGGIDISNEQCIAACKHFYNEELWKYLETPKENKEEKKETKPKEKEPEQMSLDFDFEEEKEETTEEDNSQFEEEQEQEEEPEEE